MQDLAAVLRKGEGCEQNRHIEEVTLGCDSERLMSDNKRM